MKCQNHLDFSSYLCAFAPLREPNSYLKSATPGFYVLKAQRLLNTTTYLQLSWFSCLTHTFCFWSFSSCGVKLIPYYHINGMMQRYNLRLSDKEYEGLKKKSSDTERSINDLIREAIREYLEMETRG